ncbi:MAG: Na+/citrate or Na+/malate symporter [Glomeribacter sp. 1016415]|nr:Na+/citrate or Na+/malate symporter [Glomeribacter sp. 1016415]
MEWRALRQVSSELSVMLAALAVLGFTCAELGARLPILRWIGGPVIVTTLLPSFLVYHKLLPTELVQSIGEFWQATNILYFFTTVIIIGSILSMSRQILIEGCAKIFIPLVTGSVAAAIVGTLTGMAFGNSAHDTFFYTVVPIMAGGFGEGAIPLTLGYAEILNLPQGQLFARVVPSVVLGNLTAIVCSAGLHQFSLRFPHNGGNRQLLSADIPTQDEKTSLTIEALAAAGMAALSLYLLGMVIHRITGLPAPMGMLLFAVFIKLACRTSSQLGQGARGMYRLFSRGMTYPLLFGIGVTMTPWDAFLTTLTLAHLATIIATVFTLTVTGFFVGRRIGLCPVESAIINACHSGMGGIGDMAILTSAHRMQLMPFAQLATRIGGAFTVMLTLFLLSYFG